jgi:ubiquinol-cytochrome c reductase cytochrome b subunit
VYFIQYGMQAGWLLRGLHHFTAQAMVVLLALHLMQVVIDGAYRAPREVNFWLGLILMQIVLGLSLTGYLLPWDQKGYWATRVATNLMNLVPLVGDKLQLLVVGGSNYGHHTLTRFFALHAGLLPALLVFFLILHVYMFRRHGIKHKLPARRQDGTFWPDQVLRDAVACLAVLLVVLFLIIRPAITADHHLNMSHAGAELGAPADPAEEYSAARPEWYFLFLFQILKYFPGDTEIVGAIVLPGIVMLVLFLMPLVGRWRLGHLFNVGFLLILLGGAAALTSLAWWDDHRGRNAENFQKAVATAQENADRAIELARAPAGIPSGGALELMRGDSKTQGPRLFNRYCSACHGSEKSGKGAPDLAHFGSREWLRGLLDPQRVGGPHYFGNTSHREGDMVHYVTGDLLQWKKEKPDEIDSVVAALSAEAGLKSQATDDQQDQPRIAAGVALIQDEAHCAQCHAFHGKGEASAPDLTGWGSHDWIVAMISDPTQKRYYGDNNDRMPAFAKNPGDSPENLLRLEEIELIAQWLRGDWYEPAVATETAKGEAAAAKGGPQSPKSDGPSKK